MSTAKRHMLTALGCAMMALGMLGAVLPVLPTTPFLLIALACFSRSFPRLERWLLDHPRLGPPLRDWKQARAISVQAKILALSTMMLSYGIFITTTETGTGPQILVAAILTACAIFVASRPTPRRQGA